MYLLFIKPEINTPSGLTARPVLTSYYNSSNFRNRHFNTFNVYTSPDDTILCSDERNKACSRTATTRGLVQRSILGQPNPELADFIEIQCSEKSWEGIIKKLWPRTKYVDVIVTGSMAQYIPMLDFYSGGLPLVSTMYASSECYFGLNLNPLSKPSDVSYTLLPNMAYFEFLPVEKNHGQVHQGVQCNGTSDHSLKEEEEDIKEEAVDLTTIKCGHYYELVVTTFTGVLKSNKKFLGHLLLLGILHQIPHAHLHRFFKEINVLDYGAVGGGYIDDSQILGTILSPQDTEKWDGIDSSQWLAFRRVTGLIVDGYGTIDGWGLHAKMASTKKYLYVD
ncbi:hypothetical protein IFM89_033079 [Coptis chinensis]|uniref:GH3 middle domain-containing protein n=1 Tax=Coptis chinensis TaxID=261450 RepID=A0A835IH16_9MAGN|nr:hypothetical protein IFM89_033079 [Coptis chinensis]